MSKQIKHRKLGFYALGNGYSVADSLHEVDGDYEHVAHISPNRKVTLRVPLSDAQIEHIVEFAATDESPVSQSQDWLTLHAAPPCKPSEVEVSSCQ